MASLAAAALTAALPARAEDAKTINLPAGSLEASLTALAAQTGDELLYGPELVSGRRAKALSGRYTADQALARLLQDSDIVASHVGARVIVLKARAIAARPTATGGSRVSTPFVGEGPIRTAEPGGEPPSSQGTASTPSATPATLAPPSTETTVSEVRVTGSNIRGGSPGAPIVTISRVDLERSGYATVAGALQALPQNFGGDSTDTTAGSLRADRTSTNTGLATGVDLRGLGSDSTLILVNGRRMAGTGNKGTFSDISSIPAIAVERVEVLLDGASALYGSDAVGGVVNIILRRNLDGGEIRVSGSVGDNGPGEALVGTVFGHNWSTGSVLLSYETYQRDALHASQRDFTATSDLRTLGGTDHRDVFSFPGNIVHTDPLTAAITPFWGIPAGQNGTGLKPTDFQPGVINLYNQNAGADVLPEQRRQSVYLALRQEIGSRLEVSGDFRYALRKAQEGSSGSTATLTVGPKNPFFVSPNGSTSNQIEFAFGGLGLTPINYVDAETFTTSIGADLRLWGDWRAQAYGAFAQESIDNFQNGAVQSTVLAEALGNTAGNPGTAYNAAVDGFVNPFAGVAGATSPATLAAITSGFLRTGFKDRVSSANLEADGSLLQLPGGVAKLAVGGQIRRETFASTGSIFVSGLSPTPVTPVNDHRDVAALFAEAQIPIVGPENSRPGLVALQVSAALRAETYSDFGNTLNPRFSVQWTPVEGLLIRSTYGTSYRAPALVELYSSQRYSPVTVTVGSAQIRTLSKLGGNPGLGPETAKSWTLGFDLQPSFAPGLKVSLTGYSTDFDNRIDRPLVSAPRSTILTDPTLASFVQKISPSTNPADLALIASLLASPLNNTAQGVFLPTDFGAIIDQRYVNTGGLLVRGIDFTGSYAHEAFGGNLILSANGAWMLDYKQAVTPDAPFTELVGLATFPARFRGRLSADWVRDAVSLGASLNNTSSFRDAVGGHIDALSTVDLRARLEVPRNSRWQGIAAAFSVRNVFNTSPPFYNNPLGYGFDADNADVIGRFVSLRITKSW